MMRDQPSLLLVDDDAVFTGVLARALTKRGFAVRVANDVTEALALLDQALPQYALIDLKMPGESGLHLVKKLHEVDPAIKTIVLTGYASIATAIEAIKLGAQHYLAKPSDADEILAAFGREQGDTATTLPETPLSVERLEWEHIQKVLQENGGNISATARDLNMHRRTLQRKLLKHPKRQ